MSNIAAWQFLVTFFSPYLIALVNRPGWSSDRRRFVMIGIAVVIALGTAAINGQFDNFQWTEMLKYLVLMVGATQASYTALNAISFTKKTLDKAEASAAGVTPRQAVMAKSEAKADAVQEFKENIAA